MNCVITLRAQYELYAFSKSILVRTRATMPLIRSDELIRMMSCMDKLVVCLVFFKAYIKKALPKMFSRAIQEFVALTAIKVLCERLRTEGINEVQLDDIVIFQQFALLCQQYYLANLIRDCISPVNDHSITHMQPFFTLCCLLPRY